ncbi:MAG: membrane dipeptidase, partial [Proteobacteria bacterium]|nr:membrane dipeptidase [Pseudomonadota bacterium]
GGVMQATALSVFVKEFSPELQEATSAILSEYGIANMRGWFTLTDEQRAEASARLEEIDYADVGDFIDHVDYAVNLIGIDHVGLSSDFDGGGGVVGWWDASETANVTLELIRRGYSLEDIERLWGGNLMRVWREVEQFAATAQAAQP